MTFKHGDAQRISDFMESLDMALVPWQFEFLKRLEQQALDQQFHDLIGATWRRS